MASASLDVPYWYGIIHTEQFWVMRIISAPVPYPVHKISMMAAMDAILQQQLTIFGYFLDVN